MATTPGEADPSFPPVLVADRLTTTASNNLTASSVALVREVALLTQNYDEDEKATSSVANLNAAPSVAILMNQSKDASSVDMASSAVPDSGVTRLIRKSIPDSTSESTNPTPSISEVENDKNCQDSTSSTIIEVSKP